jgi:hypothetical protein
MRILIAGQDRSADVGTRLAEAAQRHNPAVATEANRHSDVLELRDAQNETAFTATWLRLLRNHSQIRTTDFPVPRQPGPLGACLARAKAFLWRLLRYQHDRMAFQQNAVNIQVALALESERERHASETAALEQRIANLEAALRAPPPTSGGGA